MDSQLEQAITLTLERMDRSMFEWQRSDCDAIMADYVKMLTGDDPMAKWRGVYETEAEVQELIRNAGGNCNLVTEGMALLGFHPIDIHDIKRGDVVVIKIGEAEVVGLYLDPRTACKSPRGRVMLRQTPMRAWRCV